MSKPGRKKCWSESVGFYGSTIRVAEREPGGILYLLWIDNSGKQRKRSLGHRDRKQGKKQAMELSHRLASYAEAEQVEQLTMERLVHLYLKEGLHGRTEKHRREAERKLWMVGRFLGLERSVDSLSRSDVDRLIAARRSGTLRPQQRSRLRSVGLATIRHDLVALNTALNWAVGHRDVRGRRLLTANPLTGIALPREVSPKRPVAGEERYLALKAVADQLNPRFELALDLAYTTGHRIGAILHLRWEDVSFAADVHAPFGTIRWRAEHDKIENEHQTPMAETAHEALRRAQRERPAIGGAWIFSADADPGKPTDRHTMKRWLEKAERLAELAHENGGGWHAFRRGWATRRKHLPLKDVAAAGGWKDTDSLLKCYQHADPETMFRVVSESLAEGRGSPEPIPPAQNDKGPNRVSAIGALP